MYNNPLIEQKTNVAGEPTYKIKTFDIDVMTRLTGGIAPILTYMHGEKDVTDDIRALRFYFDNPAQFIEDYNEFQAMLYQKEQHAINTLYESFSIKPKNMSTIAQILWSFYLFLLIVLPIIVIFLLK